MRKKHLVAEFAEKTEEERSKRFSKWRFLLDVKNNLTTKAFQKIEKTAKNSFFIKHGYAYQLRNIEKGDTVAYYKNRRSYWFERPQEARRWLEEQEENLFQGEDVDRPNTKWSYEDNLMVEIKIIGTHKHLCMLGRGVCLIDFETKRVCLLALDTYAVDLCSFRCLAGHWGADRRFNIRSPKAFSLIIQFEGVELTRGIFPWSKTILSTGLLNTRLTRKVRFRFVRLPSRFDKIRVPQMNIGIYQDHACLIPNLETTMRVPRVKQNWHKLAVCGGPQRFAQEGQPSWCAAESKSRSPRRLKKTRLREKGLFSKGGKLDGARVPSEGCVYRSQNVVSRWERVFAGCRMDRFCPETNMVFHFRGCHWLGCPDCF